MANSERDYAAQIPIAIWQAWCNYFSIKHFRRLATIDWVASRDSEDSGRRLAFKSPLVAVDYAPEGKGNALVISYGDEADLAHHIISAPVALWKIEDDKGTLTGFLVDDAVGGTTKVMLG